MTTQTIIMTVFGCAVFGAGAYTFSHLLTRWADRVVPSCDDRLREQMEEDTAFLPDGTVRS